MSEATPAAPTGGAMTEDEALVYTQALRKQIVGELMEGGKAPVSDTKQMSILLQTLDGIDRSALGKLRIKIEEKANANQEQAAGVIAQILQKVGSQVRPFEVLEGCTRETPTLGSEVPPPVLVDGETDTVAAQGNYAEFTSRFQLEPPDIGELS